MKKIALYGFALLMATMFSACNTVGGFGKDVQHVGEKVEDASKK